MKVQFFDAKADKTSTESRGLPMPGRNSQVSRIYAILNLLEGAPQGLAVAQVLDRVKSRGHEASKRTIYRDLQALQAAGFPLSNSSGSYMNEDDDKAEVAKADLWILQRNTKINQYLVLSPRELVALYLARQVLNPLRDTPFFSDLERMFQKFEEKLGTKAQEHLLDLTNEMRFEPGPKWGLGVDPDVLETVRAACAEGQQLSCTYASANSASKRKRTLGPHYLYFAKGSLYLLAEDIEAHQTKTFAIPRMSQTVMLDVPFDGPRTEPEKYFSESFGVFKTEDSVAQEVVLRFMPKVAPFVRERSWHHSQKVVSLGDGSIQVKLYVDLGPELVQWVLGFGDNVIVESPRELQGQVLAQAEALVENYRGKKAA